MHMIKAHRWNRWLIKGKYSSVKKIAADEGIRSPSYASRILRLTLLAPDIQEMIHQQHASGNPNPGRLYGSVSPAVGVTAETVRFLTSLIK